ncbi:hypothetical protein ABN763_15635 [Spongiivirga sp. MCCC 1A20706]|uniref:hypothetical protein n=1 Tax=Spongiivirga sp. MCCC 1A20706 TaxID=3160963 RepID=UPI00397765D3
MKFVNKILIITVSIMAGSCTNTSAQKFETLVVKRSDGLMVLAIDKITADINYNIVYDHKKTSGDWKKYGEPIKRDNKEPLQFQAISHGNKGTVFWAIEPNGKTYVTNDFQNNPNRKIWLPYGNTLNVSGNDTFQFHAILRAPGKTSLIAINQNTGERFFMHTFGDNSKK